MKTDSTKDAARWLVRIHRLIKLAQACKDAALDIGDADGFAQEMLALCSETATKAAALSERAALECSALDSDFASCADGSAQEARIFAQAVARIAGGEA